MQHVIVIGGGVIGCLSALNLLERGFAVRLIERRRTGQEASWAGGGIVSPLYPWRYSDPVSALADWSQGYYPQLGVALAQATGIDPEISPCGLLWLDHAEQAEALGWAERQKNHWERLIALLFTSTYRNWRQGSATLCGNRDWPMYVIHV